MNRKAGIMARVEAKRLSEGLSQALVAQACGLTQGHYSKLTRGREPGRKADGALRAWLEGAGRDRQGRRTVRGLTPAEREEAARLLAEMRASWARLARLVGGDP